MSDKKGVLCMRGIIKAVISGIIISFICFDVCGKLFADGGYAFALPMIVGAVLSGEGQFWYLWFIFFVISYKLGFDWFATAVFAGGVMEILCGNIVSERILNVKIIFAALGMIAARVFIMCL